jgi:hypothetical protein
MENIEEKKKWCPFKDRTCADYCAWYATGLNACVIFGINRNLGVMAGDRERIERAESKKGKDKVL